MSAVNPYQPPRADVADVQQTTEFSTPRVWSARGRIGRLRYLSYTMVGYLLIGMVAGIVGAVAGAAGSPDLILGVTWVLMIPYLVLLVLTLIQRSHDMGWSGWTCLLALIPFVGLLWVFKAGTPGPNRFGAPPPANGLGVKLGALLLPAIMVIGILAAVALPAYSDYAQRAKAAQMQDQ